MRSATGCQAHNPLFRKHRTMHTDFKDLLIQLTVELENFEETAKYLIPKPGEVPRLKGIDIFAVFTDLSTRVERSESVPSLETIESDARWPTSVSATASVHLSC